MKACVITVLNTRNYGTVLQTCATNKILCDCGYDVEFVDGRRQAKGAGREVTEMDESQAYHELHPGAVYMHEGVLYEVLKLDLEYIDNWSLASDIRILLMTVWVVIMKRGAR